MYGGFSLAIAFPEPSTLQTIFDRHESVGLSLQQLGEDDLGGSLDAKTVPRTVLPYSVFSAKTPWFSVLSKRWKFPLHINEGELRAEVVWPLLLGQVVDLDRLILIDASDNEVTAFTTARGRSSSPSLNPVLLKRASAEAIFGFRLASTWTSTLFQPPDLGTRLTDDDPLLGAVVRPLRVGCRLVLVFGAAGQQVARALKAAGWTATLWWSVVNGRKYDLERARGRGYLQSLCCSGHIQAVFLFPSGEGHLDPLSEEGEDSPLRVNYPLRRGRQQVFVLDRVRDVLKTREQTLVAILDPCTDTAWSYLVKEYGPKLSNRFSSHGCIFDSSVWLKKWELWSSHPQLCALTAICPSVDDPKLCCPGSRRLHAAPSAYGRSRAGVVGPNWSRSFASVCSPLLRRLWSASDWESATGSPCFGVTSTGGSDSISRSPGRISELVKLLWA